MTLKKGYGEGRADSVAAATAVSHALVQLLQVGRRDLWQVLQRLEKPQVKWVLTFGVPGLYNGAGERGKGIEGDHETDQ